MFRGVFGGRTSQRGFSFVELTISLALIAISTLLMGQYVSAARHANKVRAVKASAKLASVVVKQLIKSDTNWALTLANSTNTDQLKCFREPFLDDPSCTNGTITGGLDFYIPSSVPPIYSTKVATNGLTMEGNFCNSFDEVNGNDACPLRVEVDLILQCSTGCIVRNLLLAGRVLYRPQNLLVGVNMNGFDFEENRLMTLVVNQTNCEAYGGTYDSTARTCSLPTTGVSCANPSQAIEGFENGLPVCEDI